MKPELSYSLFGFEPVPFSLISALSFKDQLCIIESNTFSDNKSLRFISLLSKSISLKILLQEGGWKPNRVHSFEIWRKEKISVLNCQDEIWSVFAVKSSKYLSVILDELYRTGNSYLILHSSKSTYVFATTSEKSGLLTWVPLIPALRLVLLGILLSDPSQFNLYTPKKRWKTVKRGKSVITNLIREISKKSDLYSETDTNRTNDGIIKLLFELISVQRSILTHFEHLLRDKDGKATLRGKEGIQSYFSEIRTYLLSKKIPSSEETSFNIIPTELELDHSLMDLLEIQPVNFLEYISPVSQKTLAKGRYTPLPLAESLVVEVLLIYENRGFFPPIKDLRVFDPAMGTGILLIVFLEGLVPLLLLNCDYLTGSCSFIELRKQIYDDCLFGNDIDINAVENGRSFLNAFCGEYQSRNSDFIELKKFRNRDFVRQFLKATQNKMKNEKYGIILSNPPFGALHSRFTQSIYSREEITELQSLIPKFTQRRINSYCIFLGLALQYVTQASSGLVGFVVDSVFFDLPSYNGIRSHLIQHYTILSVLGHFKYIDAVVDLGTIVISKEKLELKDKSVTWRETIDHGKLKVNCSYFLSQPHISLTYNQFKYQLDTLFSETTFLGDIAKIACGLEYGSLLKSRFLSSEPSKDFFPVLDGASGVPHPFILFWVPHCPNSYVRVNKDFEEHLRNTNQDISITGKRVLLISGNIKRFTEPKIVLRQTAPEFISVYDNQGYFALRNLHVIYNVIPPYSFEIILGILNSRIGKWIGEELNIIRKRGFRRYPQIRVSALKRFPIIVLDKQNEKQNKLINSIEETVTSLNYMGKETGTLLRKLWNQIQIGHLQAKESFPNQRRFIQACTSNNLLSLFPPPIPQKITQDYRKISKNLTTLKRFQTKLDSYVLQLYSMQFPDLQTSLNLPITVH
ncbi:MAG: TaqI-like C-terminal specificity domain-containing protein [Candidatus Heimdallarchaeota archaeon]